MTRYTLAAGTRLEALTDSWAAFSALSGDTLQLNAEAAAVLEHLAAQPMEEAAVAEALASEAAVPITTIAELLHDLWPQLLSAGLICKVAS